MRRLLLPILAHLIALPLMLLSLVVDGLTDPDPHRRADVALLLFVAVLVICWLCGVFKE